MEFWNSIGVSVCVCFLSFLLGVTLALCGMSVGVRVEVGAVSMFFFFFFVVVSGQIGRGTSRKEKWVIRTVVVVAAG